MKNEFNMQKAIDVLKNRAIIQADADQKICNMSTTMSAEEVLAAVDATWDLNTRRKIYREFVAEMRELAGMGYVTINKYGGVPQYKYHGEETSKAIARQRKETETLEIRTEAFLKKHKFKDLGLERFSKTPKLSFEGKNLKKLLDIVKAK